jgi:hypothetical protein
MSISSIKLDNGIPTLYVKGEPFFALAGEIHNSSASNLKYMDEKVWPNLRGLNMNSVIVPLYWETLEPEEGVYCYELLDGLIAQARREKMHIIFLWFGLWKNGESMYVPGWMKKDIVTYFRVKKVNGESINTISPLCEKAVEKDAKAFAAVMAHIRMIDEEESTVIMMQVENEIGLLGTARDYSDAANDVFSRDIPEVLEKEYGKSGAWQQVFHEDAEESFMAYYFAKAVQTITEAGQQEYPIPCYANAWLKQYPWYAGSYPSGGPVKEMHRIWKVTAPALATLAPDIYVPYVADILDEYSYEGNPLFVPEVRKDAVTASYCLYAFGKHNALCYSPFGIEELVLPPEQIDKPPMEVMIALNIDPSAFEIEGSKDYLGRVYGLIEQMKPLYLQYRGSDHLQSYVKKSETDFGTYLKFQEYDIAVSYAPRMTAKPLAAGMIYELAADKFLVVGMNSTLTFRPKAGENVRVDYVMLEEGELADGEWKPGRILNGDEKISISFGDMANCYMVELYKY